MIRLDIIEAAKNNNFDKIKKILSENPEFKHDELDIALYYSFIKFNNQKKEIILELLKAGAKLHKYMAEQLFIDFYGEQYFKIKNRELDYLLYHYILSNDYELVELLLKVGANPNAKDGFGVEPIQTPLIYSALNNRLEIAKLLIKSGAKVNFQTKCGYTALHAASYKGNKDIVKLLIDNGADVNHIDSKRSTALIQACYYGYLDVIKLLVENGANINLKEEDGFSALMCATQYSFYDVSKYLIDNGADVNSKTNSGLTALTHAISNGDYELIELLEKNGAK